MFNIDGNSSNHLSKYRPHGYDDLLCMSDGTISIIHTLDNHSRLDTDEVDFEILHPATPWQPAIM